MTQKPRQDKTRKRARRTKLPARGLGRANGPLADAVQRVLVVAGRGLAGIAPRAPRVVGVPGRSRGCRCTWSSWALERGLAHGDGLAQHLCGLRTEWIRVSDEQHSGHCCAQVSLNVCVRIGRCS